MNVIKSLTAPRTLKQPCSFRCTLNDLQKLIPNLHNLTCEFREFLNLCNKKKFIWNATQDAAFKKILDFIAEITDFYHYDPAKNTMIECDASHHGLGACLEQETDKGLWAPFSV